MAFPFYPLGGFVATPAHDKYYLKSLHDEIDLFDRKLAHMLKYDSFNSDAERKSSTEKLINKRNLLARTARQLVSEGIEFKASDLPRSFRNADPASSPEMAQPPLAAPATPEVRNTAPVALPSARPAPSPFAGTVLDGKASVEAYKRARSKTPAVQH
jgi:hypothetical protein